MLFWSPPFYILFVDYKLEDDEASLEFIQLITFQPWHFVTNQTDPVRLYDSGASGAGLRLCSESVARGVRWEPSVDMTSAWPGGNH